MAPGNKIARPSTWLAKEVGDALKAARGSGSRRALATHLGVSPGTLRIVEEGAGNPTLGYVEAIGEAYGVRFRLVAEPLEEATSA